MKYTRTNVTYCYELNKKQFLRWEKLSNTHNLDSMLKSSCDSIERIEWDGMFGAGIFVTVVDERELVEIGLQIKWMIENLPE